MRPVCRIYIYRASRDRTVSIYANRRFLLTTNF